MATKDYVLLLLALLFCAKAQFDATMYPGFVELHPNYNLHYRVDGDELFVALEVATAGFAGFGLAEPSGGAMVGSDIVTVSVDGASGMVTATDRYVPWVAYPKTEGAWPYPVEDESQDWNVVSGQEFENADGIIMTIVELSRKLVTEDIHYDRPVGEGSLRVVWAYGETDAVSYHGGSRGATAVTFHGGPDLMDLLADADLELHIPISAPGGYNVPPTDTIYACHAERLPEEVTQSVHVVRTEVYIQPEMVGRVHHILAYGCPIGSVPQDLFTTSRTCFIDDDCKMVFAWALGQGPLTMPAEAGLLVGPGSSVTALVWEVHYDNPTLSSDLVDMSYVTLRATSQLRPHNVGIMELGDGPVTLGTIPAQETDVHFETTCDESCTNTFSHPLNVFASFLHMHPYGHHMWSSHYRGDVKLRETNRADYWNQNFQQAVDVDFEIRPGDRLHTHCVYDTTRTSTDVVFGLAGWQEMCIEFLMYYPEVLDKSDAPIHACGHYAGIGQCGNQIIFEPNPSSRELGGDELMQAVFGPDEAMPREYDLPPPLGQAGAPCDPATPWASCESGRCGCVSAEEAMAGQARLLSRLSSSALRQTRRRTRQPLFGSGFPSDDESDDDEPPTPMPDVCTCTA